MTIAVIGASGFVGSRLYERFRSKNTPCKLFDKNIKFSENIDFLDVTDPNSLKKLSSSNDFEGPLIS